MAGLSPNSANISRTKRATQQVTHLVVHPEYQYWRPDWTKIRDAIAGEREIKRKGSIYLRPMRGSEKEQFEEYLDRAVFYNMAGQTQNGMVGQIFRRPPTIRNLPVVGQVIARSPDGEETILDQGASLLPLLNRFAKDGTSHMGFAKTVVGEQIALGRFGALIDAAPGINGSAQSFAVGYSAENIVDWTVEEVNGFWQPTRVLLREFERIDDHATPSQQNPWIGREGRDTTGAGSTRASRSNSPAIQRADAAARPTRFTSSYTYRTIYRELILELQIDGTRVYKQFVYVEDPLGMARDVFVPMIRGNTINFIPFVFFGAASNAADCEKPPLLDIVDLNLKHYRNYAELEHGRFYTAMPTFYAPGNADNDASEYHIGPSTVWEVPSGEIPGIIEFKGEGLKTLERALNEKEQQIAAIGGRLMPGMSKSVSESDNQVTLREANEQSLLLNVIMALEEGMTMLVRYWLMFRDVNLSTTALLRYEVDTTFLSTALDARSLRAIQQLYEGGVLPIDALYENFIRNAIIPSSLTLEEFTKKMKDPNSFVGQPDAEAMRRGYANRAQELGQAQLAREADFQQQELDQEERRLAIDEEKLRIAAAVDSTSVAATRTLGDPEQADAPQAVQEQVGVQRITANATALSAKTAAKAKLNPPKPPAVAAPAAPAAPAVPKPKTPGT